MRPAGRPNAAASGFLSGIIREPLAGQRAVCPVDARTEVALSSPARALAGLLLRGRSLRTPPGAAGPGQPARAHRDRRRHGGRAGAGAGPRPAGSSTGCPTPASAAIVTSWPARFRTERAEGLGLLPDPDFGSIIRGYLAETRN